MKKIIKIFVLLLGISLLLITYFVGYIYTQQFCEINRTNEFNMKYNIEKEHIIINIKRNDLNKFKIYKYTNYNNPIYDVDTLAYKFRDKSKFSEQDYKLVSPRLGVPNEDSLVGQIITMNRFIDLSYLLYEDGILFSKAASPYGNFTIELPLENYNNENVFYKKIEIKDLINGGKFFIPPEKRVGEQEIILKVNLFHDPMLKECSVFESDPIKVNIGKYLKELNE